MPVDENKKERLARLAREKGIRFYLDPSPEDWPEPHSETFSEVYNIETVKFGAYLNEAQQEPEKTPWKLQKVRAAEELVQLTKRCIDERLPEAGWRSKLEPEIFGRFTHGVSCASCGGRLWRALEDPSESTFEPLKRQLKTRREHRQECECVHNGRPLMQKRVLNELFSSRSGEYLVRDREVDELLPKQGPDLVYGLRKTEAMTEILSRKCVHTERDANGGRALSDAVQTSPYTETSDPLLFPFIIAEFKSEKNAEGFDDIQNQTALPIWRLLRLQMDLRFAARTMQSRVLMPLVWFFALRGDDVRIYAAYNSEENSSSKINVLCLLDCRISKKDGALRLLLTIDHLFEWARDIYCPLLKHQLQLIVAPDPDDGTNATTLRRYRKTNPHDADLPVETEISDAGAAANLGLQGLDTEFGIVQSACYIRAKARGLIIKSSNVNSLFTYLNRRTKRAQYARKLADKIIRHFRVPKDEFDDRCLISEQTLCQLERMWTGTVREPWGADIEQTNLWVKIQHSTYLSHEWEQVREISYIAVSREGLKSMRRWSKAKLPEGRPPLPIEPGILERMLAKIREGSVEHNLAAAISRCTLSIPQAIFASDSTGQSLIASLIWDPDVPLKRWGSGQLHEMVVSIFETLQNHREELEECRLRESIMDELQQHQTPTWSWPINIPRLSQVTKDVVIVLGEFTSKGRAQKELGSHRKPDLCVFTLNQRSMSTTQLGSILSEALLGWMFYVTWRRDWSDMSRGPVWPGRADRNTKLGLREFKEYKREQYGVLPSQELAASIVKWMEHLGQTVNDNVPLPPTESYLHILRSPTADKNAWHAAIAAWDERMFKCVAADRNHRGIRIEQEEPPISDIGRYPRYDLGKHRSKSNVENRGSERLSAAALGAAEGKSVETDDIDSVMSDYSFISPAERERRPY